MKTLYPNNKIATLAIIIAFSASLFCGAARSEIFQDIQITVRGNGKPVLMIPGLNSAAAVWDETCEQLQASGVQCHIVQLPGFAGQPPARLAASEHFLETMRDRLLAYIAAKKLHQPVLVGHSLGGFLTLQMALKKPSRLERLIVVDALPFFPAARDPKATVAGMKPFAESLRSDMLRTTIETYQIQLKAKLAGMTRSAERLEILAQWGLASDRTTTAQALYEMNITDLRADLNDISLPTLVLGSWAGFASYGGTQAGVRNTFVSQYRNLKNVRISLSEAGYHFLMWDDAPWLVTQIKQFIEPI